MQQERVSLDKVADYIAERIGEKRVSVPQMPVEMGGEAWLSPSRSPKPVACTDRPESVILNGTSLTYATIAL